MQGSPVHASDSVGWYVHLPFCRTKCGYCDFYSLPTINALVPQLVESLIAELRLRDPQRPVRTIFVGGGTPTELPAESLEALLGAIGRTAGPVAEWTVEANPSSATDLKLDLLRRNGVNRISFGAQSFFEDELAVLERIHNPAHISDSVTAARRAGFTNINLDLIYGIPGQSLDRWHASLDQAVALEPAHLSCYALMYEPGTALTRQRAQGRVSPCDESLEVEMFESTIERLKAAGYEQYEISNFARPGRQCEANLIYWRNEEYLGIGPSAVSFLDGARTRNVADVRKYVQTGGSDPDTIIIERERLTGARAAAETAIQWLRLTCGIDRAVFRERSGHDARALFASAIATGAAAGLVEVSESAIRLTRRGQLLSNYVMRLFLDDVDEPGPAAVGPGVISLPIV